MIGSVVVTDDTELSDLGSELVISVPGCLTNNMKYKIFRSRS